MIDISALQTISIAIASAGVFAAAIYYIIQIKHQTKLTNGPHNQTLHLLVARIF